MGGTNPYIEKAEVELPKKAYTITFRRPDGPPIVFEVDPSKLPYGPTGLPGSILDIALNGGAGDRKSTRLNSSHDQISYAVFCLKKKKQKCTQYCLQVHTCNVVCRVSVIHHISPC